MKCELMHPLSQRPINLQRSYQRLKIAENPLQVFLNGFCFRSNCTLRDLPSLKISTGDPSNRMCLLLFIKCDWLVGQDEECGYQRDAFKILLRGILWYFIV